MTTHRIKYQGPASMAVRAATLLADADGVELTSSKRPEHPDALVDRVLLGLTVEGTTEAVNAAVGLVRDGLPAGASITIDES